MSTAPSRRLHIAFYLPALPAGGLERVTLALCAGLLARGHRIDLVLEWALGDYLDQIPAGVSQVVLVKYRKRTAYGRLLRHWPAEGWRLLYPLLRRGREAVLLRRLPSLVDYFDNARPDVVIAAAGDIPFLALWAARMACRSPRIVVAEHNTMSARLAAAANTPDEADAIARRIEAARRLYPGADALIAVSKGVAEDMARTFGIDRQRIAVQYNPVALDPSEARGTQAVCHRWLANDEFRVVLAAGRLVASKHFDLLLAAFRAVHTGDPSTRLIILGEGPQRDMLVAKSAALGLTDCIDLPGWQPEIHSWARRAQLFVLCSRFERFGLVLVEAMAAGCPIVSTDCPSGPAEILDNGRYGRLVPVGDCQALAAAIRDTLDDTPNRDSLRSRAGDFSLATALDGYEAILHNLMENTDTP